MADAPVRVLIAEDQDEVRGAFRIILDAEPDILVVAEATDGVSAVDQARHLRPDVILADIRMPRLDGLEVTRLLAGAAVEDPMRVVVITTFDLDEYVHTALRHGACGFLLKRSAPALLVQAVRSAVAGDTLISPQVTVRLLRHLTRAAAGADRTLPGLTARELEITRVLAHGKTNSEIAEDLFLALGTVKNHVAAIQRKLGKQNRVGIAAWAWETGVVGDQESRT
jgi:DNA-binding NarL/FixJ family response regulator